MRRLISILIAGLATTSGNSRHDVGIDAVHSLRMSGRTKGTWCASGSASENIEDLSLILIVMRRECDKQKASQSQACV
ncbi:hypothetical protein BC830DRAFT_1148894, partial [Chytriomyces sp. MP71]